jgi:hypothetical protein
LLGKPVDELGLVAAGDPQRWLAEQRPADLELALVALGVDDPDATGRDHNVVDVRRRAGYAPIMQDREVGAALRERLLDEFLADGTARPARFVLRRVLQHEDDPTEPRVTVAD